MTSPLNRGDEEFWILDAGCWIAEKVVDGKEEVRKPKDL